MWYVQDRRRQHLLSAFKTDTFQRLISLSRDRQVSRIDEVELVPLRPDAPTLRLKSVSSECNAAAANARSFACSNMCIQLSTCTCVPASLSLVELENKGAQNLVTEKRRTENFSGDGHAIFGAVVARKR